MMKKYIETILQSKVPENKGYVYVTTELVEVPVYKVRLSISKRHITNLELVEEMVLRLSATGVTNLDTISGVLGLPRDIIDITVGDLHLKNLAFHSSGNCVLMAQGREALKSLSISNREKDVLHNVFVDAITGSISGEKDHYYQEGFLYNETKMKHLIEANSLDHYRKNMDSIRLIFEQSVKAYMDDNMKVQDELVSIDSIDDISTGFISVPIHIYVSESGFEIDIIAQRRSQKQFLEDHKGEIIEQLRTRKLLPNLTNYTSCNHPFLSDAPYLSCQEVHEKLKSLLSKSSISDFEDQACAILFSPRMMFETELIDFCEVAFKKAEKIEIMIDNLNYWVKSHKFLTICSFVNASADCHIYYSNSSENITSPLRKLENSCPNIPKKQILKSMHGEWFQVIIDSKLTINLYSESVKVFSENRYMFRTMAYIS
ncbi:MAG TPA: hypothetical protein VHO66_06595 [Ruminiclostridium sp.]|nr:hypothetical protein [Ruminiclostridium sp.]